MGWWTVTLTGEYGDEIFGVFRSEPKAQKVAAKWNATNGTPNDQANVKPIGTVDDLMATRGEGGEW